MQGTHAAAQATHQVAEGRTPAQSHNAIASYRREHLLNLSPQEVIRKLYDVAIMGCKKKDTPLAQKALTELIASLNFEADHETALNFFRLYDYCKRRIREGYPEDAVTVLAELRAAWVEAFRLQP